MRPPRFSTLLCMAVAGLLLAGEATAQCKKRILVYIDVSGSTKPMTRGPESPYSQSLEALRLLLATPGFVGEQDEVWISRFGTGIEDFERATGADEARQILDAVDQDRISTRTTDFESVFADLERTLGSASQFDRQVVILASDFHHEPEEGRSESWYLAGWSEILERWRERLQAYFDPEKKVPLVLFQAPATTDVGRRVGPRVRDDLAEVTGSGNRIHRVDAGKGTAARLAEAVQQTFYSPIEVSAHLESGQAGQLSVEVFNPSCFALTLDSIAVGCGTADPNPRRRPVTGDERLLPENGSQRLAVDVTRLDCGDDFHVTAVTAEGVTGERFTASGTWLDYTVEAAVYEGKLLGPDILTLDLTLRGLILEPRDFPVVIETPSGREVARRNVRLVENVEPEAAGLFQATFSVPSSARDELVERSRITIRIIGARTEEVQAEVQVDSRSTQLNAFLRNGGVLIVVVVFLVSLRRKRAWRLHAGEAAAVENAAGRGGSRTPSGFLEILNTLANLASLGLFDLSAVLGGLAMIAGNLARSYVVPDLAADRANSWKLVVIVLGVTLAVFAVLRAWQNTRLIRQVFAAEMPTLDAYTGQIKRGWLPLTAAALAALACWLVIPRVIPPEVPPPDQQPVLLTLYSD